MPKTTNNTKTFLDVLTAIKSKGLKITSPVPGTTYPLGQAKFTVLAPNGSAYEDANNYSVVTKLTFGKTSFLLTGDAEDVSETQMLAKKYNIKADLLKVGHHGSLSSTSPKFLSAVKPKYAVISVGKGNTYGHPKAETLAKLKSAGVTVYRTDLNGTVIATSDGSKITIKTLKNAVQPRAPGKVIVPVVAKPATSHYVGNSSTHKFHRLTCSRLPTTNRVDLYKTRAQVIALGYNPCQICKP